MRQTNSVVRWALAAAVSLLLGTLAGAEQLSSDSGSPSPSLVNKANDPLTAASAVNLQNYYQPSLYGAPTSQANSLLFRAVAPFKIGLQQIARATLPLNTPPNTEGRDPKSGIGDLDVFDIFLLTADDVRFQFGIGPMVTFPTAFQHLGTGKWQVGGASVVVWQPDPDLLMAALVTFQTGIAGDEARPATDQLVVQPIVNLQVGSGFYLRSTASQTYNFASGQYVVPLGIGAGKVVKSGPFALNFYLEPQFTILHRGLGQPTLQVAGGLNVQYFHPEE